VIAGRVIGCVACAKPAALVGEEVPADGRCPGCRMDAARTEERNAVWEHMREIAKLMGYPRCRAEDFGEVDVVPLIQWVRSHDVLRIAERWTRSAGVLLGSSYASPERLEAESRRVLAALAEATAELERARASNAQLAAANSGAWHQQQEIEKLRRDCDHWQRECEYARRQLDRSARAEEG
jgi:hypothetical protein